MVDLIVVGFYSSLGDGVAEEVDFGAEKVSLFQVHVKVSMLQGFEDSAYVLGVFFEVV